MDSLRKFFVLNRIRSGASPNHWRPTSVVIQHGLTVAWPQPAVITTRVDPEVRAAVRTPLPDETADDAVWLKCGWVSVMTDAGRVWCFRESAVPVTEKIKRGRNAKLAKNTAKVEVAGTAKVHHPEPGKCECFCDSPRGYLNDATYYNTPHECIFKQLKCACGCEDDMDDTALRKKRLAEYLMHEQVDVKIPDNDPVGQRLLNNWIVASNFVMVARKRIADGIVQSDAVRRRIEHTVNVERAARKRLDQHLDRHRVLGSNTTQGGTLEDITVTDMPLDRIIDGMCTAVHQCHSLRVFHRNISMRSFAVYTTDGNSRVVLRAWDHACFNPGNTSYRNSQRNRFKTPTWGEVAPELSGDTGVTTEYGFEYDMWCLGLVIFELMYGTALPTETDPADFTDAWLDAWIRSHPVQMPNAALYTVLLRIVLTTNAGKRACAYAAANMTDGPRAALFGDVARVIGDEHTVNHIVMLSVSSIDSLLGNYAEHPAETARRLRDHIRQPARRQPGHWQSCQCMDCQPAMCPLFLPTSTARSVQTGIMRSAFATIVASKYRANELLAASSQIADAILTDAHSWTVNFADFGTSASDVASAVQHLAHEMRNVRIRI